MTGSEAGTAGLAALTGIGVGLVSASGAAATLIRALNAAYGVADRRTFLRQRLTGLLLVVALLVALVAVAALIALGPQVRRLLLPAALEDNLLVRVVASAGQLVLALGVAMALFAFIYWVGPNRPRPRWQWLSPGAVLGVLGWVLVSLGFRPLHGQRRQLYSVTYATFAGVIVLLLWLQLTMALLLVGAELNAETERRRDERRALRARELGAPVPPPSVGPPSASRPLRPGTGTP